MYPQRYFRRYNFTRDKLNNIQLDVSKLDLEFNEIALLGQQLNDLARKITNADGTLKHLTPGTAKDLLYINRQVATAGQTAFTVPAYDSLNDLALAWSGSNLIDLTLITKTDDTTVTLPAQALNTVVTIVIFTAGSGTLSRLADTETADEGASLVGIRDAGGLFNATTVEDALAEMRGALDQLLTDLGSLGRYILADGSVPFAGNQSMGGFKLTGLAAGAVNGDAVRYEQLQAVIAQITGISSAFLPKAGGTMSGPIDMSTQKIIGLGTPTASTDAATKGYVDGTLASFGAMPVGAVIPFAGTAVPSGWLLCDGSAVNRTTYANLFTSIGVTYGVGDGSTTFNVPDLQGRTAIGTGSGSGLTTRSLNDKGGEETHVLTISEMPAHDHSRGFLNSGTSGGGAGSSFGTTNNTGSTGGGLAHNNMQPYIALKFIIKV